MISSIDFCMKTANIWKVIGNIILIIKIIVPILIIILGIIELSKAAFTNDEKAVSKATISLIKKIVIGLFIFFIPTIINVVFKLLGNFAPQMNDYKVCYSCLLDARKCDTSNAGKNCIILTDENKEYCLNNEEEQN